VANEPPIKYFVQKGIKPPFKSWGRVLTQPYKTLADGKTVLNISKAVQNYEGFSESI